MDLRLVECGCRSLSGVGPLSGDEGGSSHVGGLHELRGAAAVVEVDELASMCGCGYGPVGVDDGSHVGPSPGCHHIGI